MAARFPMVHVLPLYIAARAKVALILTNRQTDHVMTVLRTPLLKLVPAWAFALLLSCGGSQSVANGEGDDPQTNGSIPDDCEDLRYAEPPSDQGLTPPPDVVQPGDDPLEDCLGDE